MKNNYVFKLVVALFFSSLVSNIFAATSNADFTLQNQKSIKFNDIDNSNFVSLQAPATVTGTATFTLPGSVGTNGQVLTTNGSGVLSWSEAGMASVDTLTSTSTSTALSANQGRVLNEAKIAISSISTDTALGTSTNTVVAQSAIKSYVDSAVGSSTISVADNLTSTSTSSALSANQGKILKTLVDAKINIASISTNTALGTSTNTVVAQSAIKSYVDSAIGSSIISVEDNLTSTSTSSALSANQGKELKTLVDARIKTADISNDSALGTATNTVVSQNAIKSYVDSQATSVIDNLTSNSTSSALSANQGKVLNEAKINIADISDVVTLGTATNTVVSQNAIKTYVDTTVGSAALTVWRESFTTTITVGTNTTTIKQFASVSVSKGRKVKVSFSVPYKSTTDLQKGMVIGLFAKLNGGSWINLGNSGYLDENEDFNTKFRRTIKNEYILDFDTNELRSLGHDYTLIIALRAKSLDGSVEVNPTDTINDTSLTDPDDSASTVKNWAGEQNFTNLIIKEL